MGRLKVSTEKGMTILTDEIIEKICKIIKRGAYIETACAYVGIHKDTYHDWLKKAANNPGEYTQCVKFAEATEQAMAFAELRDLQVIDKAATGTKEKKDDEGNIIERERAPNWHAAAWKLERRNPERWGNKERVDHTSSDGSMKPQVIVYVPKNGRERKD